MEQINNMEKIESAQQELCQYLISMMPVEWSKICLYIECEIGSCSVWFAFLEKNTGEISTQEYFWERYDSYPVRKRDVNINLTDLAENLFNAYIDKFGIERIWRTYFLTINEDYSFNAELGYDLPEGNWVEQHHAVFRKFFNSEYKYLKGKYPY